MAKEFDYTTDVLVIGSGGSGLPAALSAKQAGAEHVMVVDRRKVAGGTGAIIGHMFAVESPAQRRAGVHITNDEVYARHMECAHWACDARMARDFINNSGKMAEWLETVPGIRFNHVSATSGVKYKTSLSITEDNIMPITGRVIADSLARECKKDGVEFLMGTRVRSLLKDGDRNVVGVYATQKDKELKIGAKAVIVATGSITGNAELRKKFYPEANFENTEITASYPWITGDGYLMTQEAGALKDPLMTRLYIGPTVQEHMFMQMYLSRPYDYLLNKFGMRFVNEDLFITNDDHSMLGSAVDRQPLHLCYGLMDSDTIHEMVKNQEVLNNFEGMFGQQVQEDFYDKVADVNPQSMVGDNANNPCAWLDSLEANLTEYATNGSGLVCKADTLEEVAAFIGCNLEDLKAQVDRINENAANHYDAEFMKASKWIYPVKKAPFFVVKSETIFLDSIFGGIRVDNRMRVLHESNEPFTGLYAAGIGVSGFIGSHGLGALDGTAYGSSVYSGYTAGKEAAGYAAKLK